jgi:hypothetical protein
MYEHTICVQCMYISLYIYIGIRTYRHRIQTSLAELKHTRDSFNRWKPCPLQTHFLLCQRGLPWLCHGSENRVYPKNCNFDWENDDKPGPSGYTLHSKPMSQRPNFHRCRKVCIHLGAGVSRPHYVVIRHVSSSEISGTRCDFVMSKMNQINFRSVICSQTTFGSLVGTQFDQF